MNIHITRDGKQFGPYTLAEVNSSLQAGTLRPEDLAWQDGMADWVPLRTITGVSLPSVAQRPPPPPPAAGMPPASVPPAPVASASAATSKAAIASLVFGILGLLLGLPALLGLPLGIYAMIAIKNSSGRLRGNGLAIAGVVCSCLGFLWLGLAAIAIPNFTKARSTAQKNACIANLKQIDGATQQWALENKKVAASTYSLSDPQVLGYLRGNQLPVCPAGGTYAAGRNVADSPRCSIPGHSL
jgi:competence protein ComGC